MRIACAGLCLPVLLSLLPGPVSAAKPDRNARKVYIRANYTKFEYRVPMRDGVRLFTSVYVPNDRTKTYPILMVRTPYTASPYGLDRYKSALGPTAAFEKDGFIFVTQDVRGRFLSEGEYVNMRPHIENKKKGQIDESTDTYDTIEWLIRNVPNNNRKVGQWGISYPGFYTSAGAIDSHPALKAVSPQAPIADWFWDDMHHHGAFILPLSFNFFSSFGVARSGPLTKWPDRFKHGTPDGYQFFMDIGPLDRVNQRYFKSQVAFWDAFVAHPNYDDFWKSRNILPHLKNIKAAVLVVGGWFDTEDLYGPLKTYASIEKKNPRTFNALVMGPWSHGQWARKGEGLGSAKWGFDTAEYYNQKILLPFFKHYLKGGPKPSIAEATVFETGANRWRTFTKWPPRNTKPVDFFVGPKGTLGLAGPSSSESEAFDEFVSDPAKPVPYTMEILTRWAKNYMTEDQRFAAWRPDVLVYQTVPLEEPLTLAGPIEAKLWVSTSQSAADWIVKVIDVYPGSLPDTINRPREMVEESQYPGGRQMLVRAEVMRGRFRNSYEKPEPFVPNQPTEVSFQLNDTFHTFKRGHRLMVQIQSTWFPFVDRNPQKYVPNIFKATESDFVKATHRVYRSPSNATRLQVRVLRDR